MSHVHHLAKNKAILSFRFETIRLIREWFWNQGFLEVETPQILRLPGQEPYLSPMKLSIHNERGEEFTGYLHTSPEYTLKKMLAAGFDKIFSLGKVFRDHESFGGTHNPEFTMIEWYRGRSDMFKIMEDVEGLFKHVGAQNFVSVQNQVLLKNFERVHMRELWQKYVGVNLDEHLRVPAMFGLCKKRGYSPEENESYEDLFYRIFLNEIEPQLGKDRMMIVHHYPLPMAALAKASEREPGYAERFEVYVGGLELANAFSELTDADEQERRLREEQVRRRGLGKDVYDIDTEFIEALRTMPPAAGIALGVDRLVQLLTGCKNIDDVIPLPASELF